MDDVFFHTVWMFCLLWPVEINSDKVGLKHFFPLWAWEHCSAFTDSAVQPWADHSRISLIKGFFLAYHCLNERMWHWGNFCVVWCKILTLKMSLLLPNLLFGPSSINASLLILRKWFVFVHRYLFALQIKQDISSGRLTCNDTSAALMVSHIVQCKYLEAVFSLGSRDHRVDRRDYCFPHTQFISKHCHVAQYRLTYWLSVCCYGPQCCVTPAEQPLHME